jgi:hypothetical protein
MPPKIPTSWRFAPPKGLRAIREKVMWQFFELVEKVASQGDRWDVLEMFKGVFAGAIGAVHVRSSSEGWALTDLRTYMKEASKNPPLFLQALLMGFETAEIKLKLQVPNSVFLNQLCRRNRIPLQIVNDEITLTTKQAITIRVAEAPSSLREEAAQLLSESISRSEQLMGENRGREAVQEILWVLESLVTGFRGITYQGAQVKGKYFNQIVQDLKKTNAGIALQRALEWCEQLHGYLSSPTGGAIRHGVDINKGIPMSNEEARFFCNLIRSYVSFLQTEHERLCGGA